jgi:hypothetical protein
MYKISISGRAGTGKDTSGKIIAKILSKNTEFKKTKYIAFADSIKEIANIMFPEIPKKHLYGSSKYRTEVIFDSLTIRQLLLDLGDFGKNHKNDMWLSIFKCKYNKAIKNKLGVIICPDARYINELNLLKDLGFVRIRILRDLKLKINHSSEIEQDSISNDYFDYIVYNNGSLEDLEKELAKIAEQLRQ